MTNDDFKDATRICHKVIRSFGPSVPADYHEDIAQSVILRCLEKYDQNYGQKFTTSLHRYATWACINFLRDHYRAVTRMNSLPRTPPREDARLQGDLDHLRECMGLIPNDDRLLIEQRFLMGMTLREIGVLNGYTPQAAMKRVHGAVDRLRRVCLRS
jgi:RNA polymerase sigma factor (sigma-70 family)